MVCAWRRLTTRWPRAKTISTVTVATWGRMRRMKRRFGSPPRGARDWRFAYLLYAADRAQVDLMLIPSLHDKLYEWMTRGFGALFPPPGRRTQVSKYELERLGEESDWIDRQAGLWCLLGFVIGLALPYLRGECTGWDIGLMFGLASLLSLLSLAVVGAWIGRARFRRYTHYASLEHGFSFWAGVWLISVPCVIWGLVAAIVIYAPLIQR